VEVHASALKHGISSESALTAAANTVYLADLDEDSPVRQLRLGFDETGRLLELVVLTFDDGNEMIIHAMKVRTQYLDLLD